MCMKNALLLSVFLVCMQNTLLSVCRMHYCFSCMYAKCIVVYYPTTA